MTYKSGIWRTWLLIGLTSILSATLTSSQTPDSISSVTIREIREYASSALRLAAKTLREMIRSEAAYSKHSKAIRGRQVRQLSFSVVQTFLGSSLEAKQISYSSFLQTTFLSIIKKRFNLSADAVRELQTRLPSLLSPNNRLYDSEKITSIPPPYVCPYPRRITCNQRQLYRTFNGMCNNLVYPMRGAANQPLTRLIDPDYSDGIGALRKASDGNELPNPRLVSIVIHTDVDKSSESHSLLLMLFGQFLDHDISRTATSILAVDETGRLGTEEVKCGDDGCKKGRQAEQTCVPIEIPHGDPVFHGQPCLEFVRTLQVPAAEGCAIGPRQQLNQITSYLDNSNIYGSSLSQAKGLRDTSKPDRGQLRMQKHPRAESSKDILPKNDQFSMCNGANNTVHCFTAGDGRVNENLGLMSLHTIFAREHNRIETMLATLNPHWNGEILFQETRRIVIAIWQRIIYKEYLPIILGDDIMRGFALNVQDYGHNNDYDSETNSTTSNAFATAAFRFGHSQISSMVKFLNRFSSSKAHTTSRLFSQTFRRPEKLYEDHGADHILRGFMSQRAQTVDRHITAQVTEKLFSPDPPTSAGMDLVTINIQRGRDHGLPGYNKWREWCGIGKFDSFIDLYDVMVDGAAQAFERLYRSVDDIDIFPAGLSEKPTRGSLLGPTFSCIIAMQFRNLKRGDRFWHENNLQNPHPFTPAQLAAIRTATLANIICRNGDNIGEIPRRALLQPYSEVVQALKSSGNYANLEFIYPLYAGSWNERVACSMIPDTDLSAWKQKDPILIRAGEVGKAPSVGNRYTFGSDQVEIELGRAGERVRISVRHDGSSKAFNWTGGT